jgi:CBS domain-containing protein
MACARDVMQTQVITVSSDAPLATVRQVFIEEGIHGAPVVDDRMAVLGVISTTDLLRAAAESRESARPEGRYDDEGIEMFAFDALDDMNEAFEARLGEACAGDYMTESAVCVAPDASIAEVASAFRKNQVHRVLVVEDGTLQGIVSTLDLITLLEKVPAELLAKTLPTSR